MSGIDAAFHGHVVRDADLKISKAGKSYLRFTVRVGDGDGATFVSVMAFDDVEGLAPSLAKGASVYVEGSIKVDEWTAQDGTARHGLTVMARFCRPAQIGRHRPPRRPKAPAIAPAADAFYDDELADIGGDR